MIHNYEYVPDWQIFKHQTSGRWLEMIGKRIRVLREGKTGKGPVIYWMSRDQRAEDNWALLYAQEQAIAHRLPLVVCFLLVPEFLED